MQFDWLDAFLDSDDGIVVKWIINGLYFDYLDCCIEFFCNEWSDILSEKYDINCRKVYDDYVLLKKTYNFNRIPCMGCLQKAIDEKAKSS